MSSFAIKCSDVMAGDAERAARSPILRFITKISLVAAEKIQRGI